MAFERELPDARATHALGLWLGQQASPGTVYALVGELGAGKTTLTRGIAEGWGVTRLVEVVSPTYALMFDHPGTRGRLVHVDLYRLESPDDLLGLGVEEAIADREALVVIEWADRIPSVIPEHAGWIRLRASGSGRCAVLEGIARPGL